VLNRTRSWLVVSLLTAILGGCGSKEQAAPSADDKFAALEREYVVYFLSRFPVVATYLGGAAFDPALKDIDGKLRDHSAEALQAEDTEWNAFRERFAAVDATALSPRRRIDRNVATAQLEFLLRQHRLRRYQERAIDTYVDEPFRGVDWQIQGMTATSEKTYGTESEWRALLARVNAIPAFLATAEKQLAAGVVSNNTSDWRPLMQFGLRSAAADADYFSTTLLSIAERDMSGPNRDALVAELKSAAGKAADAYRHLHDYVATTFFDDPKKSDVTGVKAQYRTDRYAFGETEYNWALQNNLRLETSAADLYEKSWPIVEATRQSMIDLAAEIATSRKWKFAADKKDVVGVVFAKVGEDAPKNDNEMVGLYRETGVRLVEYARRTRLFDVPADYKLDVTITPPPLRSAIEGAAYYPAPPFKTSGVGRFYVTPTDDDLEELRQSHNRAALADLAAHEGFPGHDWHYKVMVQHRQEISPVRWLTPGAVEDSSSMWEDSMAAEGWALYSEALLSEPQADAPNGFYTPEERLYQLRGKLFRDLRVRIDTGIHTGRLSFDEAVSLFSAVVDFQPGSCSDPKAVRVPAKAASCKSSLGAIMRYARWPTQAITYRIGKDQIFELRSRAQRELGDQFSPQRFHVEFMKQGTIPSGYFADELMQALRK
jgi:uncharacterized protein (DUF885 family)